MIVVRCVDARRCEWVFPTGHRCGEKATLVFAERDLAYCAACLGPALEAVLTFKSPSVHMGERRPTTVARKENAK